MGEKVNVVELIVFDKKCDVRVRFFPSVTRLRFEVFNLPLSGNVKNQILQSFGKANRFSNAGQFAKQIGLAQKNVKCQIKNPKHLFLVLIGI
jgi:hypothetical protein